MIDLRETLETITSRIKRYGSKGINEQDTKATLIQPILRAIGWDVEDLEQVQREYKQRKRDKPVDYAIFLFRTPCLFLEAKAYGQNLDDRRWANQIMGYASVAGVEWVVLTDGNEYRLYNSHATVPIEEKLFRTVRITEDKERAAESLGLLSIECMRDKKIDVLWKAHFVDRQVNAVIHSLFDDEPDASLIRLVKKRVSNLTTADIRASLRRAEVRFDFPVTPLLDESSKKLRKPRVKKESQTIRKGKQIQRSGLVYMSDIIAAGLAKTPLQLYKKYKGHDLKAIVRANGEFEFDGQAYKTPSTAAESARATVTGRKMNTNGWTFWQFQNEDGKLIELDSLRQAYNNQQ